MAGDIFGDRGGVGEGGGEGGREEEGEYQTASDVNEGIWFHVGIIEGMWVGLEGDTKVLQRPRKFARLVRRVRHRLGYGEVRFE